MNSSTPVMYPGWSLSTISGTNIRALKTAHVIRKTIMPFAVPVLLIAPGARSVLIVCLSQPARLLVVLPSSASLVWLNFFKAKGSGPVPVPGLLLVVSWFGHRPSLFRIASVDPARRYAEHTRSLCHQLVDI